MLKTHHSTSDVIMSVVTSLLAWGVVLCQADAFQGIASLSACFIR